MSGPADDSAAAVGSEDQRFPEFKAMSKSVPMPTTTEPAFAPLLRPEMDMDVREDVL
jgi:hypothetical protein